MRKISEVFAEKLVAIVAGVARKLKAEGASVGDNVVKSIADGYMLMLQMVWYRIPNDSKVDTFINTYEVLVQDALTLLSQHSFNDIVQSYRAKYTNLYTAKGGARVYRLNFDTCQEFIKDALAGKTTIAKHVIQRQPAQPKPVSNSLLLSIANKLAGTTPIAKPVAVKQETPKVVVAEKKVESKIVVPGFFTDLPANATIEEGTFVRITLTDKSKVFGRWSPLVSPTFDYCLINKQGNALMMKKKDVVSIATYTKAVRS